MAAVIKLKRGTSTPSTSDIASGEVAIDTSAAKLYINDSGTVKEIGGGGGVTSDAQKNTVAGTNSGDAFDGTSATNNTLFGYDSGTAITTGDNNTCIGQAAGSTLTTAHNSVFMGNNAGQNLQTGNGNVAIGQQAGQNFNGGHVNTALCYQAGAQQTSG